MFVTFIYLRSLTWDVIEINEILNNPQILVERITKEQAAERGAKAIQEAFTMLVNHGLPYLDRALKAGE
jgi:hypothetical protein